MVPKPPEGYRLAETGETYYPKEGDKPALWWGEVSESWIENYTHSDDGRLTSQDWDQITRFGTPYYTFAIPLDAANELVVLSQGLGLYDMTGNPPVKGENDGSPMAN